MLGMIIGPTSAHWYWILLVLLSLVIHIRLHRVRARGRRFWTTGIVLFGATCMIDWSMGYAPTVKLLLGEGYPRRVPDLIATKVLFFTVFRTLLITVAVCCMWRGLVRMRAHGCFGSDRLAAHCPNHKCSMRLSNPDQKRCPECGIPVRVQVLFSVKKPSVGREGKRTLKEES